MLRVALWLKAIGAILEKKVAFLLQSSWRIFGSNYHTNYFVVTEWLPILITFCLNRLFKFTS